MEADKLGSGLVNVVLGALILWVAQTTFQHSGELAGFNQKFDGLQAQHDNVRDRMDALMEAVNERTRSRFTSEDGEKIAARIEQVGSTVADLERRLAQRVTELQLKVIAIQTQGADQRELARLRTDLERLNASLGAAGATGPVSLNQRAEVARSLNAAVNR